MMLDGVIGHLDWTDCAYCAYEHDNRCGRESETGEVEAEVSTLFGLVICRGFEPKEGTNGEVS